MSSAPTMHNTPRRTLAKLLRQYGDELLPDPRRTEALLNDHCGKHTREIFVLVQAQRRRVPAELRASPAWMPLSTTVQRLTRNLETQLAFTPEAAAWAVETWAIALGLVKEEPEPTWYARMQDALWPRRKEAAPTPAAAPDNPSRKSRTKPAKTTGSAKGRPQTRQTAQTSVQSATRDRAFQVQPASLSGGTRLSGRMRSGWRRTTAFLRQQVPVAILWISVLVLSSVVGWALLDGSALSGALNALLGRSIGSAPTAAEPNEPLQAGPELARTLDLARRELEASYTPQLAWVIAADGLNLRAGPSLEAAQLFLLPGGQSVTVIGFSPDGRWAQLDAPHSGWASTEYLAFSAGGGHQVRISVRRGRIQTQLEPVVLRDEPSPTAAGSRRLAGGVGVTLIAETFDGQWVHVATPDPGWLMSAAVEFFEPLPDLSTAVGLRP